MKAMATNGLICSADLHSRYHHPSTVLVTSNIALTRDSYARPVSVEPAAQYRFTMLQR